MQKELSLVYICFFAALTAALGLMPKFDIAFLGGVPITAQTLGIMLAGAMLGPWRGSLSIALLLLLVAVGLPLLAGGRGGIAVFYGPSGGFLVGWIFGAMVTGFIMQLTKGWNLMLGTAFAAIIGGIGVVYLFGIPYLALKANLTMWQAFTGSLVYIPGDLVKVVASVAIVQTVARGMPSAILTRAQA
ncbi:biotin transporter BioY [Polycladidibacter stylochi]|uniref:biotin transporter BioY n=1 Tax=Polycladidibacter stylochi TaxID=1807766 RepID=UPI00082AFA34|nr:biotin transporter BioY [Pseudovibrio stylochi]